MKKFHHYIEYHDITLHHNDCPRESLLDSMGIVDNSNIDFSVIAEVTKKYWPKRFREAACFAAYLLKNEIPFQIQNMELVTCHEYPSEDSETYEGVLRPVSINRLYYENDVDFVAYLLNF